MATVNQILNAEIPKPTWVLQPGQDATIPSGWSFSRSSSTTTFGPNGKLQNKSAGVPRVYGPQQGLVVEGGANNQGLYNGYNDLSPWGADNMTTNANAGTRFGQPYGEAREEAVYDRHRIVNTDMSTPLGATTLFKYLIRPVGRRYCRIGSTMRDNTNNNSGSFKANFDLQDESVVDQQIATHSSIIDADVQPFSGDWKFVWALVDHGSNHYSYVTQFYAMGGPTNENYTGETSKGFDFLAANVLEGVETNQTIQINGNAKNGDSTYGPIPEEDWNNDEGTFFVEIAPLATNFPRRESILNGPGWALAFTSGFTINARDIGGTNAFIGSPNNAIKYKRNKIAFSFKKGGGWACSVNGGEFENLNDHNGSPLTRPNPLYLGSVISKVYYQVSYIPSYLNTLKREALTSI
jgi:hypothetical protein